MDSDVGKLFIGGISWETTEDTLRAYFGAYGDVVEAVIMKDRATGRARGFGFVVFADPAVADSVVKEKHTIDGRQVEAKKAVPRDEQHNATRNGNNGAFTHIHQAKTKKIFVGGLPATVTELDFRKYFDQFGFITDVVVMYDHATQRPRGFGFITYDSEDAVDKVLHKSFHELKGKMVEVKRAIPKETSPSPSHNNADALSAALRVGIGGLYSAGYGHFNSSPITSFNSRIDSRQNAYSGVTFSPYGATGYGSNRNFFNGMNAGNYPYGRRGNVNLGRNASIGFGGSDNAYGIRISPTSIEHSGNLRNTEKPAHERNRFASSFGHNALCKISSHDGFDAWTSGYNSLKSNSEYHNHNMSLFRSNDNTYGLNSLNHNGRFNIIRSSSSVYNSLSSPNSGGDNRESNYGEMYSNLGFQDSLQKLSNVSDPFSSVGFRNCSLHNNGDGAATGRYSSTYGTERQSH